MTKIIKLKAYREERVFDCNYHDTYYIDFHNFSCSDSFCARNTIGYMPNITNNSLHVTEIDFLGFYIESIGSKKISTEEDIEEILPDFYNVAKAWKAVFEGNLVKGLNKWHAILLFKMLRQNMDSRHKKALQKVNYLITELGIDPFKALILGYYFRYYKEPNHIRLSLFSSRDMIQFHTDEGLISIIIYSQNIDTFVKKVLPLTKFLIFAFDFHSGNGNDENLKKNQGYFNRFNSNIRATKAQKEKSIIFKNLLLAEEFKEAANMIEEKEYFIS